MKERIIIAKNPRKKSSNSSKRISRLDTLASKPLLDCERLKQAEKGKKEQRGGHDCEINSVKIQEKKKPR